jgi:hypothetical protein
MEWQDIGQMTIPWAFNIQFLMLKRTSISSKSDYSHEQFTHTTTVPVVDGCSLLSLVLFLKDAG